MCMGSGRAMGLGFPRLPSALPGVSQARAQAPGQGSGAQGGFVAQPREFFNLVRAWLSVLNPEASAKLWLQYVRLT